MITEKNATYLYVANVTTGISDGDTIDVTTLPAGAVVVGKVSGGNLVAVESTALSANETYQIINKLSDGTVLRSPMFKGSDVISKSYLAYAAPQEQVSYLGYDGSSITGLGTITAGTNYIIGLWLNHTKGLYDLKGEVKHISASAISSTQWDLVTALLASFKKNFSPTREPNPTIRCERVGDGTYGAATTGVSVTQGSVLVSKASHGLSVGDIIRLSESSAPGNTSALFKVIAKDTNSFTLDYPWEGATTSSAQFAKASPGPTKCGLKFTGIAQPFNPVTGYPTQVSFDVLTDSFGEYGVEYKAVAPTPGNGTYAQVAELEMYAQGNEQWARNSIYPTRNLRMEANSAYTYNIGTIVVKPSVVIGSTGTEIHSPFTLVIAAKTGLVAPALNTILG